MYSPLVRYLDRRLFVRKLVHVAGGLVAASLVLLLPVAWSFVIAGLVILGYWSISRRISLALLTPMFLLALTGSRLVVTAALVILALGDGAAALLGRSLGRTSWPWHPAKTLEGSLAFWLAASMGLLGLLWLRLPELSLGGRLLLASLPPLGAGAAESLPFEITQNGKPDDNMAVVLAGGLLFYVLCLALRVALPAAA